MVALARLRLLGTDDMAFAAFAGGGMAASSAASTSSAAREGLAREVSRDGVCVFFFFFGVVVASLACAAPRRVGVAVMRDGMCACAAVAI